MNDVVDINQHLICEKPCVASATHVIYAYRIEQRGKIIENFESDRDWGTGYELLKAMKKDDIINTVFIATRQCNPGFAHLGKKRFSHIIDACMQAYDIQKQNKDQ